MQDINFLSKNVRAKKEKEIERIRMAAPRLANQTKGQKVSGKFFSINFFRRFFKKTALKPSPEDAAIAAQSLLQTPKETLPPVPPQIPPSPLKPMPIPEVMRVQLPQKPSVSVSIQPKPTLPIIKKMSDGIILPDISSIVQKNIEKQAAPTVPIAQRKLLVPPPPPIKKIEVMPSFEKKAPNVSADQVNIGAEKNIKPVLPKTEPAVSVMPQKSAKAPPSVLWIGLSGALTIAFAGSIAIGSFLVLNRWVSAFEKVEKTYEERYQSVSLITSKADPHIQEARIIMEKTRILYNAYGRQEADEKKFQELRSKIISAVSDYIDSPIVSFVHGVASLSGMLKQDKTIDGAAGIISSLSDPVVDKIIKKEKIDNVIIIQFSLK